MSPSQTHRRRRARANIWEAIGWWASECGRDDVSLGLNKVGNSTSSYLKDVLGLDGVWRLQRRGWGADIGEEEIGQERSPFTSSKDSGTWWPPIRLIR